MVPRLYLDTNILIDFFFERLPFSEDASKILEAGETGRAELYISALSLANLAYCAQKVKRNPVLIIESLLTVVTVVPLSRNIFSLVNHSTFKDYEDGLQYFTAKSRRIDAILTRNKKDFKESHIPVYEPTVFLKEFPL